MDIEPLDCRPTTVEHKPTLKTREMVADMFMNGIPKERICRHLKISEPTLNKYYEDELDLNKDYKIANLSKSLYRRALDGDQKAAEFWLKTQGGFYYAKSPEDIAQANLAKVALDIYKQDKKELNDVKET